MIFYYVVLQNGQMQGFLQEDANRFCHNWLNARGLVRAKVTTTWQCRLPASWKMCINSLGAAWRILEPCRSNWQEKSNWNLGLNAVAGEGDGSQGLSSYLFLQVFSNFSIRCNLWLHKTSRTFQFSPKPIFKMGSCLVNSLLHLCCQMVIIFVRDQWFLFFP